jgi:putative photosynthetic complex assembly protein 2
MTDFALGALFAVLIWWFTTGIILWLDSLPMRTFRWSMAAATVLAIVSLAQMRASAADTTAGGAYAAFSCAIVIWGWLEMSFLMGYVTGPRKQGCAAGCSGWRHFVHGAETVIYNEIAILAGAGAVFLLTAGEPNRMALWTFLILWGMRLSAKLNLFLGVPNLGDKLLPPHLSYLKGFFKKGPVNLLFPFSVVVSTMVTVLLAERFSAANGAFQRTSYALLTSLLALAVLEHWFMVIPLPSEKLWNWAFKRSGQPSGWAPRQGARRGHLPPSPRAPASITDEPY